eukprot:4874293-Amphidinium_carterae.2
MRSCCSTNFALRMWRDVFCFEEETTDALSPGTGEEGTETTGSGGSNPSVSKITDTGAHEPPHPNGSHLRSCLRS